GDHPSAVGLPESGDGAVQPRGRIVVAEAQPGERLERLGERGVASFIELAGDGEELATTLQCFASPPALELDHHEAREAGALEPACVLGTGAGGGALEACDCLIQLAAVMVHVAERLRELVPL